MADAAKIIAAKIDPQINELRRQLALAAADNKQGMADTTAGYNALAASAAGNVAEINKNFNTSGAAVDSSYANLQKVIADRYGASQAGNAAEMERMGLQRATPQIQQQSQSDQNLLASLMGSRQTSERSANNLTRDSFASGARQGGEIAKATGQRKLGELRNLMSKMQFETTGKIGDLEGSRGGLIEELQMQMDQAKAEAAANAPGAKDFYEGIIAKQRAMDELNGEGGGDAFRYLQQAAGKDAKKGTDLANILETLQSGNYNYYDGDKKAWRQASNNWKYGDPRMLEHLQYAVGQHSGEGWGQNELESLQKAIDIYFGRNS